MRPPPVDDQRPTRPNVSMKRASIDAEIRARVHVFVAGLTTLVKLATLQEAVDALEGGAVHTQPTGPVRMRTRGANARVVIDTGGVIALAARAVGTASVPSVEDYERAAIQRALVEADGNMANAGKLLGRSRAMIYRRAQVLGVSNRGALVRPRLGSNLPLDLDAYERAAIYGALNACSRDKAAAAKLLRMGKSTIYRRMGELGMVG